MRAKRKKFLKWKNVVNNNIPKRLRQMARMNDNSIVGRLQSLGYPIFLYPYIR